MHDHYDHHLPQYHVSLERGYLNDPNGPIQVGETIDPEGDR